MSHKKIFLIGFMGAGKSTIGRLLASDLGFSFVDTDVEIEKTSNQSISDIFQSKGESHFRELEKSCLQNLLKRPEPLVIATGGGLPCYNHQINVLKEHGVTIYLECAINTLEHRLEQSGGSRPLLMGNQNITDFLKTKLAERNPIYKQAQVIVQADGNPKEVVEKIKANLR